MILLPLLFSCAFLPAQSPVITSAVNFHPGDSLLLYHKHDASLAGFSPGPSGANVSWDFSAMDFNHPSVIVDTLFYLSPVGTPFYPVTLSADYSQSNLCRLLKTNPVDVRNEDYSYYLASADSLSFIGHWADNSGSEQWEDHCSNFIKELSFPFSHTDNYSDSFTRFFNDMSGSDEHYITGTYAVMADGYGSLITPDGTTIPDVLRLHAVESTRDSNGLFGITMYTRHIYRWYTPASKGFILSLEMDPGNSTVSLADYQKQTNESISLPEKMQQNNGISIYPNPNNGIFTIRSATPFSWIEIRNVLGEAVFRTDRSVYTQQQEFNISFLPAGIYFMRTGVAEKSSLSKFVIE
ncbi:MAG: hypothetical protein K0S33_2847 [Bacteroidetes bacterium]|nr:hypothetical protein [Bacteroidota bacterium]